jgi:hypothetical protein
MARRLVWSLNDRWCVVIIRELPCTRCCEGEPDVDILVDDIVTVYGPMSREDAIARVNNFNRCHGENDDGSPSYTPVSNAPAFLKTDTWVSHYATARPMNDVPW